MSGPLAGIRVLDLMTVQMGPWCTRILADFGADVIKVEAPEGDSSRFTGVPRHRGMSGSFQHNARGKRSLAIDLKQPAAQQAVLRLAPTVDAFASNIRPAALARLGLDYDSVRKVNPSIVYLSMVGYGSAGRYAGRPAYDDLIQAAAAIPMLLQRSTGQPRFIPMAAIDRIVGSAAANALLAGLLARARTGIGQMIEVPMFETMAQFVLSEHMQGQTFDPPTSPAGYPRTLSPHRRPYATKDGFIAVLPYNDGQWRRFFAKQRERRTSCGTTRALPTSPAERRTLMPCMRWLARNCGIGQPTNGLICWNAMTFPACAPIRWRHCWTTRTLPTRNSSVGRSIRPKAASAPCVSPAHGRKPRRRPAASRLGWASRHVKSLPRQGLRGTR